MDRPERRELQSTDVYECWKGSAKFRFPVKIKFKKVDGYLDTWNYF